MDKLQELEAKSKALEVRKAEIRALQEVIKESKKLDGIPAVGIAVETLLTALINRIGEETSLEQVSKKLHDFLYNSQLPETPPTPKHVTPSVTPDKSLRIALDKKNKRKQAVEFARTYQHLAGKAVSVMIDEKKKQGVVLQLAYPNIVINLHDGGVVQVLPSQLGDGNG